MQPSAPTPSPNLDRYHRTWADGLDHLYPAPTVLLGLFLAVHGEHPAGVVAGSVLYAGLNVGLNRLGQRYPTAYAWQLRLLASTFPIALVAASAGAEAPGWGMAILPIFAGVVGQTDPVRKVFQVCAALFGLAGSMMAGATLAELGFATLVLGTVMWLSSGFYAMLFPTWVQARENAREAEHHAAKAEGAAAELRARNEALEHALKARQTFLATMSHDVRTPLNGVLSMADLLRASDLPPEHAEMVEVIRSSGTGLLHILDDLPDTAKLDAGRIELEHRVYDPTTLGTQVLDLMRGVARGKGLELSLSTRSLPPAVVGDPGRHRQVLLNLVGHAVTFTEEGRVQLTLAWSEGWLSVRVDDTGIGIPASTLARLFRPFEQGETGITRRYGGTGLGLAISHRLVSLMGGQLEVSSTPGNGASFFYRIPAPKGAVPATAAPAPPSAVAFRAAVLVVDDNPVNHLVATRMLEGLGCEVVGAHNGLEALEAADARAFDLILMDCRMPVLDGQEATRRLRRQGHSGPILALTAGATDEELHACAAAGMDDVLVKPVSRDTFREALRRWVPEDRAEE